MLHVRDRPPIPPQLISYGTDDIIIRIHRSRKSMEQPQARCNWFYRGILQAKKRRKRIETAR